MYLHVGFPLFYHNFHSEIIRYALSIDVLCRQFHKPVMAPTPSEPRPGRNYQTDFRVMPSSPTKIGICLDYPETAQIYVTASL